MLLILTDLRRRSLTTIGALDDCDIKKFLSAYNRQEHSVLDLQMEHEMRLDSSCGVCTLS